MFINYINLDRLGRGNLQQNHQDWGEATRIDNMLVFIVSYVHAAYQIQYYFNHDLGRGLY